jgi:sterol desaturase/sphingolipid hydroxylase (fatty acid hydroxylase superfamily)
VFRRHWLVDLTYFFINSLLMEVLTILTLKPALILFDWARGGWVSALVGSLPVFVQVPVIVCVADFTQYWMHRIFHAVPFLWRFHAIHHSAEEMDWLAGSRLHRVDVIVTRGLTYIPIFVLGFSNAALMAYVFLVAVQATFIHANVRWQFRAVRRMVATSAFHHWHHSADSAAVDKNFLGAHARLGHPVRDVLPSRQMARPLRAQRPAGRAVRVAEAAAVSGYQTPPGLTC